jgi:hypothetical protein
MEVHMTEITDKHMELMLKIHDRGEIKPSPEVFRMAADLRQCNYITLMPETTPTRRLTDAGRKELNFWLAQRAGRVLSEQR